MPVMEAFSLADKVVVITGGGGLMGERHALAVAEAGGTPVLWDLHEPETAAAAGRIAAATGARVEFMWVDITDPAAIEAGLARTLETLGGVHVLINNAANDPKVGKDQSPSLMRLENLPTTFWNQDIAVGLTGAFLCARSIGTHMARNGGGVILNVASDLGVIAPDQRLYRREGLADDEQPVKPVTYSVVKHGLIGLTKYLATYWADKGVRCNAISPGGVRNGQPDEFVARLTNLIPMGRMAERNEYMAAVVFLCSEASAYMTGQNLIIDGGRTVL